MPLTPALPQTHAFIATSLDGFIARPDDGLDWLHAFQTRLPAGEDCGYAQFMRKINAIVMGRHTFQTLCTFPEWPYGHTPVIVLSSTLTYLPPEIPPSVRLSHQPPQALVAALGAEGFQNLYIDGGQTLQRFLAAGLIDTLTLTTLPLLLGSGKPLFGPLPAEIPLEHVSTQTCPLGLVQSVYRRQKSQG